MPTYANDLRLKEITTGDESGTWGTSTNTNLALIADAFSLGTKQMAANADETFTMPDATADGTRSLYLKITSAVSLTATRTVTLAPNTVSKVWIIENATTGSQIITIRQGSGATVNVPSGQKVMIVTDGAGAGAAVVNANPSAATGGTVTSVAVTVPSLLSIAGSPITSSGTLAFTYSGTALPVANGGTGATTLTGVLKGNGTGAFTAATAGTDFVAPATATTFTATQTFSGSTSALAVVLNDAAEVTTVSATAATGTINYDITTQSVLYYTTNASANWTVNFRASSGTSLNTALSTGQSVTVAFLVTQGATAYYNNVVQVDGTTSGVTTRWIGGAPVAGNASGIDSYRYLIIKTGSAAFTVLASVTQFKA